MLEAALQNGARIRARDIAGILQLPYYGNVFYVDPSGGSDSSNSGTGPDNALATVALAYEKMTSGAHDVTIINPTGGSGRTSETTAITWAKRFAHLIGNAAPLIQDNRAGVGFATGGSFVLSENGNIFKNLTFFSSADIDETVSVTGSYNGFYNVDFKGTYNATSADSTPWRALNIAGGQENYFKDCSFGGDTYTRGAANATLELESAASRNVFEDCHFFMHNDTANTPVHVLLTGTSAIDRWLKFKNCSFYSFWTNDADKTAAVINASAQTATGHILLEGITNITGFDDIEASASNKVYIQTFDDETDKAGLMLNNS